jgi:Tfp pilus assembly protein PilP
VRCLLFVMLAVVSGAPVLRAQTPPPAAAPGVQPQKPTSPASPAPPATAAPPVAQPETYSYTPDGRRDPFTSLIGTGGVEARGTGRRSDGPATMAVGDISVRGVLESRGALVAMIQGPDNKTYIVHQGDKLLDGTIKTITPQGLVVIQEVSDPLSLVKQREVPKLLRSLEVVKP